MAIAVREQGAAFETRIPARMDRLPWSRWHWLVVIALGITWILDGLEVTFVGAIGGVLQEPKSLGLSAAEIGGLGTAYLAGTVIGALVFGHLTDIWGRRRLFLITLGVYLVATALSAFSWDFWSFAVFRFFTGAGIGGEYAAINSAIDELIPARVRGWADLAINGTFWVGAAAGSLATYVLLDPRYFHVDIGWRLGFGVGALLGLSIIYLRRFIPESPRWLMIHGDREEAEDVVRAIEEQVVAEGHRLDEVGADEAITIRPRGSVGFAEIAHTMLDEYRGRSVLALVLVIAQAYLYNATFFTYPLILTRFYGVAADRTGLYLLPFAVGNFLGPILLGRFFDTIGRKPMICATYAISAVLLALTAFGFSAGTLTASTQTLLWSAIFFFASAAASSAYLTVSEIFPMELRAMAIAFFFALGTLIGGVFTPYVFGRLIDTGSRMALAYGYGSVVALLLVAVVAEALLGVKAERTSLEKLARPLSMAEAA